MNDTRLPRLRPEQLTASQRTLYESIASGPRASGPFPLVDTDGSLNGPFNAMLLSPGLGGALQQVGEALRYRGILDDRCREIAILVVATAWESKFERFAHEAVAAAIGMTTAEIGALRGDDLTLFAGRESLVARIARHLAADRNLSDGAFAEALEGLGREGLFELVTLVGYYSTLALHLRVFGDEVPTADPSPG